jgi:hypothetical protein
VCLINYSAAVTGITCDKHLTIKTSGAKFCGDSAAVISKTLQEVSRKLQYYRNICVLD